MVGTYFRYRIRRIREIEKKKITQALEYTGDLMGKKNKKAHVRREQEECKAASN